jgi:hypothetical protein
MDRAQNPHSPATTGASQNVQRKYTQLAFNIGAGSEMLAPMAHAVIGGLVTSTLLTLIAVPVVYSLLDDLTQKLFGKLIPPIL